MKLIFASIAILGYVLNIKDKKLISYITWLISNSLWSLYSFYNGEWELGFMFITYNIFSIWGIVKEIKKKSNGSKMRKQ